MATGNNGWVPIDLLPPQTLLPVKWWTDPLLTQPDPFSGSPIQTNRLQAFCVITYGGVDVTSRLDPHLISVRIVDTKDSTCEIELDDRDGRLPIPPLGASVVVELGWMSEGSTVVFRGNQNDLEYSAGRDGGRHMTVHAKGLDYFSQAKQPMDDNMGEGAPSGQDQGQLHNLQDWMNQLAGNGKLSMNFSGGAAGIASGIQKDFWEQNKSSPMAELNAMADKYGLLHQFHDGNQVDIFLAGERGSITAQWGVNLISCRVRPLSARSSWAGGEQHYFKPSVGQWMRLGKQFGLPAPWGGAAASWLQQGPASHESEAEGDNTGAGDRTDAGLGQGRIMINGEPSARFGSSVMIAGVRPGVDGQYFVWDAAEHIYSRKGYLTMLDVRVYRSASSAFNVGTPYRTAAALGAQMAQAYGNAAAGGPPPSPLLLPSFSPPPPAPTPLPSLPPAPYFGIGTT